MKNATKIKTFVLAIIQITLATIQFSNAQDPVLWGMTSVGATNDSANIYAGNIFTISATGANFTQKYGFRINNVGKNPGNLMQASNHKFYGMTSQGGKSNQGVLFEYDPTTYTYTKRFDFSESNGIHPYGNLMQVANGKLYGMTSSGGNGYGNLFEYDPAINVYTKKFDFTYASPGGDLMQAPNGLFYGLAGTGGVYNEGVIFEYDPMTNVYTKKFDFGGALGSGGVVPCGNLTQASNGKMYGITRFGGTTNNSGVLFEYDPATNIYTKKLDFNGAANGANPLNGLIKAFNGKLYGMTIAGGVNSFGVLFEYDPATNVYIKKLDFNGSANGSKPYGSIMQASNGKIYGMTSEGGINNIGVLFEYDPATDIYIKKLDFNGAANGANPQGNLIQAFDGKLYGMTNRGGYNNGVLFQYDLVTNFYSKKVDFNAAINGASPYGSLIQTANGMLYGMTSAGGSSNFGVLFEYDPATNNYNKKLDFNGANGANPYGSLMLASNSKLYGMTYSGGSTGQGVLFEYDPATNTYSKKLDFNGINGANPYGSLIQASNGKLYGMTTQGGINGPPINTHGVLFEYDLATNVYTKQFDFNYLIGRNPIGSLIQASNGKLYGMTFYGGTHYTEYGVLFEFDIATNIYTKKFNFNIAKGTNPWGNLMQGSNGKLYGMTESGGMLGSGVLFTYDPVTNVYIKKFNFDGTNGATPEGSLMQGSNGKLYGMTSKGGFNNAGVAFEYDPHTNVYTKKFDFNVATTGGNPIYTNLIELAISIPATNINATSTSICKNNSITLKVQGGYLGAGSSWHWYSDSCGGTAVGIGDSITVTPAKTTTCFLRAEGSNITTCVQQKIILLALPVIPVSPESATICPGNSVNLTASGTSISYAWRPADGLSSTTNASVTASPDSTTIYTITGTTANGCSKSRLIKVSVECPKPIGLTTSNITSNSVTTNWSSDFCATSYMLQYKKKNGALPTTIISSNTSETINGLKANTDYIWKVSTQCADGSYSTFTTFENFRTPSNRIGNTISEQENNNSFSLTIHPNPTHDLINLEFNNISDGIAQLTIRNALGQIIIHKEITIADGIYVGALNVSALSSGVYMIYVSKEGEISSVRFMKE